MAGLHRTYISDVERFQRGISLENVQKIADALEIETYLFFKFRFNMQGVMELFKKGLIL